MNMSQFIALEGELLSHLNSKDFWSKALLTLEKIDVSGTCYGFVPYRKDASLNGNWHAGFYKDNYPETWRLRNEKMEGSNIDNDVSVNLILDGVEEIRWHGTSTYDVANQQQKEQYEFEKDIGMHCGISLNLGRGPYNQGISGIGIWNKDINDSGIFEKYWESYKKYIYRICYIIDTQVRQNYGGFIVNLTERERDCLTFAAIGERNIAIAWRMGITEKQVLNLTKSAREKLQAKTRDHAIAKALTLNLIQP